MQWRQFDPANHIKRRGLRESLGAFHQRFTAFQQLEHVARDGCHVGQRINQRLQCRHQLLQALAKGFVVGTLVPAQLHRLPNRPHAPRAAQAPVLDGSLASSHQIGPGAQSFGLSQPQTQHVPVEIHQLCAAQVVSQELDARLRELMGFVKNCHFDAGQQLGNAAVTQIEVSEKQVVVDDHDVGGHGFPSGAEHVATLEVLAVGAQAVLAR